MTMYFRMFLHPDNTVPVLVVGNIGAVLGAVVAHYTQAPTWVSLPACLALIVVSPLLVTFYRRVIRSFSSEALERFAGRPAQDQLFKLMVRSVTAVADTMQGVLIGILRR